MMSIESTMVNQGNRPGQTIDDPVSAPGPVEGSPSADDGSILAQEVVHLRRRVAELESAHRGGMRPRFRQVSSAVFLVLTVVAVVLATTSVWVGRTLMDTDRFMAIVEPALTSPELDEALADRLAAEVAEALSLEDRLATTLQGVQSGLGDELAAALDVTPQQRARLQQLPLPELQQLAGPIASGLQARIDARIDQLVQSDRFQSLVLDATRAAHGTAVSLVRGDPPDRPNVVVEDGRVTVDLVPAVAAALADLVDEGLEIIGIDQVPFVDPTTDPEVRLARLSDALGVELPADFGQVTVMTDGDLQELQATAATMQRLVWLALVTVAALAALTLLLATNRRRVIVQLGLGTAFAAILVVPITRALSDTISGAAQSPQGQQVVAIVTNTTLDSLRSTMLAVLGVALAIALVAHLVGRPRWLRRAVDGWQTPAAGSNDGDLVRFLARHRDLLAILVMAGAVATIWVVGVTMSSVIVVAGLALALLGILFVARRRAATTLPPASSASRPVATEVDGPGPRTLEPSNGAPAEDPGSGLVT